MTYHMEFISLDALFRHMYSNEHKFYGNCAICNKAIMRANKERLLKKYRL